MIVPLTALSSWILNKRLSILIFQWTTRCLSLEGYDTWWGSPCSYPTACLFRFSASWCRASHHSPGASTLLACASLPKGHGGELPSLLWPGVLGCLCSTWLCGLLFFRERMNTARLGGGKIKVSPSEWDPLTPLNRLALSLITWNVGKAGAFGLRKVTSAEWTVFHEASVHCLAVAGVGEEELSPLLQNLGLHPMRWSLGCLRRHLEVKGQHVTSHLLENFAVQGISQIRHPASMGCRDPTWTSW